MLVQGLSPKHIIVSFQAQRAWAFENGKVVMDSLVTTGIRGVTDIGTDFGPMKVLFRSHPYTMKSPWPKTSPHWYRDTVVQWTTFFTSAESFHDASWEPDQSAGARVAVQRLDPEPRLHPPAGEPGPVAERLGRRGHAGGRGPGKRPAGCRSAFGDDHRQPGQRR